MARSPELSYTARGLTERTHIALPTVMKVLKQLTKAGLLFSQRGSNGGYTLAVAPTKIYLIDIIVAIEGDIGLTECSLKVSRCDLEAVCTTRHNWQTISHLLYDALGQISLAQMAQPLEMHQFRIQLAGKVFSPSIQSLASKEV